MRLKARRNPTIIPIPSIARPMESRITPMTLISERGTEREIIKNPGMETMMPAITNLSQIFNTKITVV